MVRHRALGALGSVMAAIAFVFATLLLFVPIGDCGSVTSPSKWGGSIYDLGPRVRWAGACRSELDIRTTLIVVLFVVFAVALIFAITRYGIANRLMVNPAADDSSSQISYEATDEDIVQKYKRCQFCAEEIQAAAIFCKHCRRDQVS